MRRNEKRPEEMCDLLNRLPRSQSKMPRFWSNLVCTHKVQTAFTIICRQKGSYYALLAQITPQSALERRQAHWATSRCRLMFKLQKMFLGHVVVCPDLCLIHHFRNILGMLIKPIKKHFIVQTNSKVFLRLTPALSPLFSFILSLFEYPFLLSEAWQEQSDQFGGASLFAIRLRQLVSPL